MELEVSEDNLHYKMFKGPSFKGAKLCTYKGGICVLGMQPAKLVWFAGCLPTQVVPLFPMTNKGYFVLIN